MKRSRGARGRGLRAWLVLPGLLVLVLVAAYGVYPALCRRSATAEEARRPLAGDAIVPAPETGYTLAATIAAPAERIWPWLVQLGQGRAGFYTHEWVENLLSAEIRNADRILPQHQRLERGDSIRLTPDPYLGRMPGQYLVVAALVPRHVLVFRQRMPNGTTGTWSFVLEPRGEATRLLFRRRAGAPSVFDRIMIPGYYYMDMGMLAGIRARAEGGR